MKIKKLFFPIFASLTLSSGALTACANTIQCNSLKAHINEGKVIEDQYYDIDADGVLKGFNSQMTKEYLKTCSVMRIPANVKKIADFAFACMFDRFSTVVKLELNDNLEEIGNGAFLACTNFGQQGKEPVDFTKCTKLKSVGNDAFSGSFLNYGNPIDLSKTALTNIGSSAFLGCQCTSILLPNTLTSVGFKAFANCPLVKTIDFSGFIDIPEWLLKDKRIFDKLGVSVKTNKKNIYVTPTNYLTKEWKTIFGRQGVNVDEEYSFDVVSKRITTESDFSYDAANPNIITGFANGKSSSDFDTILIPTKNGQKEITEIATNAFKDKIQTTTNIEFEAGSALEKIGKNAFENCYGLIGDLIIPNTVYNVDECAFKGCSGLSGTISLPDNDNFNTMSKESFMNCSNIREVVFPACVCSKGLSFKDAVFKNDIHLSYFNLKNLKMASFTFSYTKSENPDPEPLCNIAPNGTICCGSADIASYAVTQFKNIAPDAMKDVIGDDASSSKWWCYHIYGAATKFQLEDFATTGNYLVHGFKKSVFEQEKLLNAQTIDFWYTTLEIADNAFENVFITHDLKKPYYELNLNFGLEKIGSNAFANCCNLSQYLYLPNTIKEIGSSAFYNCNLLRGQLILPKNLISLGAKAFAGCQMLENTELLLPSRMTEIGQFAFAQTKIKSIKFSALQNNITLQPSCFARMDQLETIDLRNITQDKLVLNDKSFRVSKSQGKILVTGNVEEWKTFLQQHGLPSSGWAVANS